MPEVSEVAIFGFFPFLRASKVEFKPRQIRCYSTQVIRGIASPGRFMCCAWGKEVRAGLLQPRDPVGNEMMTGSPLSPRLAGKALHPCGCQILER